MKLKFTLPRPPSVNKMYRISKHGGMYMDRKSTDWFTMCHWYMVQQRPKKPFVTSQEYKLTLLLGYCGRMDIDNCLKASLDLISKHEKIIEDDHQVVEIHIKKSKVPHRYNEFLELEIEGK